MIVKPGGTGRPAFVISARPGALAAEEVLHRAVAFGPAVAPGVDVALGGGVGARGGTPALGDIPPVVDRRGARSRPRGSDQVRRDCTGRPGLDRRSARSGGRTARPAEDRRRAAAAASRGADPTRGYTRAYRARISPPPGGPADERTRRGHPRHRRGRAPVQRHAGPARGSLGRAGELLGSARRRPDPVRGGPVHDGRRLRRRQALAAPVLRRLGASRRGDGRLRALRAARPVIRFTTLLWRLRQVRGCG